MTNKGILIVYLCAEDQDWVLIPSDDGTQDSYTRVIQESYSWNPDQTVQIGERLTKHEIVGARERRVIPAEWVVTEVESYEPSDEQAGFGAIFLAYCERQPLTADETEQQSYVTDVQIPALV